MLKFFSLFLVLYSLLNASEEETATKIIQNLIEVIDKQNAKVWINSYDMKLIGAEGLKKFNLVKSCKEAKVLILSTVVVVPKECQNKPILVLDYDLLTRYNNAVSAFFWKKGRPNIVFISDRVKKFSISLPPSYSKYVEDQIW